jgi:hypothetical protein
MDTGARSLVRAHFQLRNTDRMPRRPKNTQARSPQGHLEAKMKVSGDADQMTDDVPRAHTRDQYQHFIPRFILRRFQVGPVKCVFGAQLNPVRLPED